MKHLRTFESFENISEEKGEKWIQDAIKRPGTLRKKLGKKGEEKISKGEIEDELSKLKKKDKDPKKSGVQGLSKRDLTKLRQLNLAKKLKGYGGRENSQNIKEGAWLDFKKTFSFDKYFNSIQDMWNDINDAVHKKYPQLKNVDRNGPGFTNGGREFRLKFENFDSVKRKVSINGENVDWDNVIDYVFKLLKKESLV